MIEKEACEILETERQKGYISGKVEGALNVLYLLDLQMEERIRLLQKAASLSSLTAKDFIEPREIEARIKKNKTLTRDEKECLYKLMSNEAMKDEKILGHPEETLKFIAAMSGDVIIEKCLPTVRQWKQNGEDVSMRRVRDWFIQEYGLL